MPNIATVNPDGTGVVTLDGHPPAHVATDNVTDSRRALLALVVEHARRTGQAVELIARDPEAEHLLNVDPDGTVRPVAPTPPPPSSEPLPEPPEPTSTAPNGTQWVPKPPSSTREAQTVTRPSRPSPPAARRASGRS